MKVKKRAGVFSTLAMRGTYRLVHEALTRAGFVWEVRRSGNLKIGLWRKKWRTRVPFPKRFILVPGFGDTSLSWFPVIFPILGVLKGQYDEVILLDLPGFQSFLAEEPPFSSFDLLQNTFDSVIKSLRPHTLVGHSLGGWLAGLYSARHADHPRKLVAINPSGVIRTAEDRVWFNGVFRKALREGFSAYRGYCFRKEPIWLRFVGSSMDRFFSQTEIAQFMDSISEHHLINDQLGQVQADISLIWSEDDKLIPLRWAKDWMELKPNTRTFVLSKTGHCLHMERPLLTGLALLEALRQKRCVSVLGRMTGKISPLIREASIT